MSLHTPEAEEHFDEVQFFYDAVVQYQAVLDGTDPNQLEGETRKDIISELDEICPYRGKAVYMRGTAILPMFDEEGDFRGDATIKKAIDTGIHKGLAIIPDFDNPKRLLIAHQLFTRGDYISYGFTAQEITNYCSYFDINSSITMIHDIEQSFQPNPDNGDISDVVSGLVTNTENIQKIIRSTKFKRMGRQKQMAYLNNSVTDMNQALPIYGRQIELVAANGYVQVLQENDLQLVPKNIDTKLIKGLCLGLISLDEITLVKKAIKSDADRTERLGAICLAVDPEPDMRTELQLSDWQVLYVPSSQAMDIVVK